VVAGLNGLTSQVTYHQRSKIDVPALGEFFATLRASCFCQTKSGSPAIVVNAA